MRAPLTLFVVIFITNDAFAILVVMKLFVGTKAIVHFNGTFLLLRESSQYKDGSEEGKWDVPGGRIESDETLDEGLLREVQEECGLRVIKKQLLGAYDGFPVIRGEKCHVVRLYFLCEANTDTVMLSQDHDAYQWITPDDVRDMILMDDIEEMLTAAEKNI